jgi:hypothetical protein
MMDETPTESHEMELVDGTPGTRSKTAATSEILVLPDGRILAHNLTPTFAALLSELNPDDRQIATRAGLPAQNPNPDS